MAEEKQFDPEMEQDMKMEAEAEQEEMAAELEADADRISKDDAEEDVKDMPFVIELSKTYNLNGQEISSVDLSGIEDLTTLDAQRLDRTMAKMNHAPRFKYRDTLYTKHVAMKATGLPVEFFNALCMKDMETIASRIALYFLYS